MNITFITLHSHLIIVYHRFYDNRLSCVTIWRNPVFFLLTLSTILPATYFICQEVNILNINIQIGTDRRGWSFLWSSIKSISAADSACNCLQPVFTTTSLHKFLLPVFRFGRRPVLHVFSFASCHCCCVFRQVFNIYGNGACHVPAKSANFYACCGQT